MDIDQIAESMTDRFRQMLSTKRMNELNARSARSRTGSPAPFQQGSASLPPQPSMPPAYRTVRNIPLVPHPPQDQRSMRFRNLLHSLSHVPVQWENPGLLDEALRVVNLERIYGEAEEESNILLAEAESLGTGKKPAWSYHDCVLRALLKWFPEFFTWVNNPACAQCGRATISRGMTPPTPDERARSATQVELYACSDQEMCKAYTRYPRYNDAFVLLTTRTGRVGEWTNCFGMLCRALGARVRWVWNSEDYVWIEIYSAHRRKWVTVDPTEGKWDQPLLYSEGWRKKMAYCIAFSADGAMDVTRRYVPDMQTYGLQRNRCPEACLLYILDEIRDKRRAKLSKQEKFRLQGEDMRESRELEETIAISIVRSVCSSLNVSLAAGGSTPVISNKHGERSAGTPDAHTIARRPANGTQDPAERHPSDERNRRDRQS
ncbi:hypothetical protein M011DRAFT_402206 [Sporormia fimetaria CBS 119925]|uniref:Transglutaminase-like domain-containing protein n=1 Tax=Sporormia fimetaria CBS 119925 TaxID=1340428 RepID=A0A6A6VC60_9PLEO|nr:hypothetical protein M011DRAFT_402206 [Sporormia fimetaria CBS 119925]